MLAAKPPQMMTMPIIIIAIALPSIYRDTSLAPVACRGFIFDQPEHNAHNDDGNNDSPSVCGHKPGCVSFIILEKFVLRLSNIMMPSTTGVMTPRQIFHHDPSLISEISFACS